MNTEKPGSRLFLGRKLFPYFYKPETEVIAPVVVDDTIWVFGEQIMEDVTLFTSLLVIEDTDLLEVTDLFVADDPTIAGSSAVFVEGLMAVTG